MVTVIVMAPHYSTYKSIGAGLGVFFACATVFLLLTQRFGWFQQRGEKHSFERGTGMCPWNRRGAGCVAPAASRGKRFS